jgi:hypothetical protein
MSFLEVNGWPVPVAVDESDTDQKIIGDTADSFSGVVLTNIRARRDLLDFETVFTSQADGRAIVGLLEGRGHHWSFDNAAVGGVERWYYSSRSLGKTAGTITRATTTPDPKFGTAYAEMASGATVTFGTGYTGDTTLMVWTYTGAAWVHYIVRSDGAKWVDGVRNDAASTPFLTISGAGVVTLGDAASVATQYFDDLVVLGFKVTTTMATTWGVSAQAFSELPNLAVNGDAVKAAATFCVPGPVTFKRIRATVGGTSQAAYVISCTMEEST